MKLLKYIAVFLLIFVVFLSNSCSKENTKKEDHYDFKKLETLHSMGNFKLKIREKQITFHPSHKRIQEPLLYPENFEVFNFNGVYKIQQKGKPFYFRFGWLVYEGEKNIFKHLQWLDKKPVFSGKYESYTIQSVQIPFVQYGSISLCTIGDSQTWFSKAQKLRKYINEFDEDIIFVGSNNDVYGYPHDGEGGNDTKKLLKRIHRIPAADYYTLLIGTNDWNKNFDKAYENTLLIVSDLLKRHPNSKVLYLTPLPTTNKPRDIFNLRLSKKLITAFSKMNRVKILDLGKKMRDNHNWETDYLSNDGLHPSDNGVEFMAQHIANSLPPQT